MSTTDRPVVWLHGQVKTPPLSVPARVEAGVLLRRLQAGETLGSPYSKPMPAIGPGCHELRVVDRDVTWRIVYCLDGSAVVVVDVFAKKTRATPRTVISTCRQRLAAYLRAVEGKQE